MRGVCINSHDHTSFGEPDDPLLQPPVLIHFAQCNSCSMPCENVVCRCLKCFRKLAHGREHLNVSRKRQRLRADSFYSCLRCGDNCELVQDGSFSCKCGFRCFLQEDSDVGNDGINYDGDNNDETSDDSDDISSDD